MTIKVLDTSKHINVTPVVYYNPDTILKRQLSVIQMKALFVSQQLVLKREEYYFLKHTI